MAEEETHSRIVILNRLVSRSVAQGSGDAPVHSGQELLDFIGSKIASGTCVEFFDAIDDSDDDSKRIEGNAGKDVVRIVARDISQADDATYVTLLVEFIDMSARSFPVVDTKLFMGRELVGSDTERGATSAHVVVRLPSAGGYNDGSYRCAIESVPNVTRSNIEMILCRQLRRHAKQMDWRFTVSTLDKKGRPKDKSYRYWPRLELMADVGRMMKKQKDASLSKLVFTKRSEKQNALTPTDVRHHDIFADVRLQISASQGPKERGKLVEWVKWLRSTYELRGFTTKLYFRHPAGREYSGGVNSAIDGAHDLIMCPKEFITVTGANKKWVGSIQPHVRDALIALLRRDELWEEAK